MSEVCNLQEQKALFSSKCIFQLEFKNKTFKFFVKKITTFGFKFISDPQLSWLTVINRIRWLGKSFIQGMAQNYCVSTTNLEVSRSHQLHNSRSSNIHIQRFKKKTHRKCQREQLKDHQNTFKMHYWWGTQLAEKAAKWYMQHVYIIYKLQTDV